MTEERTLFKNISFMALSMFLPNLFNLVFLMIAARILLNTGMNEYSVIISYVTMFALFSDIGSTGILIRDVSQDRSRMEKYFGSFFTIRLIITSSMVLLSVIVANFMPYDPQTVRLIYIAALSQLFFQVGQIFASLFQAYERMQYIAYGSALQSIVFLVLGLIFIYIGLGVTGLIYANLISNFLMLICYVALVYNKIFRIKFNFNRSTFKYLVLAGIPFGIAGYLNIIYSYVDRFILSILRYPEVANYTLPYTLVMSLSFILTAYTSSVFPLFSKISVNKVNSIKYACEKSFKYLMILIIPMCVGTTLLADRIVYTIYGPDFTGAVPILQLLIWLLMFMVVTNIGSPLLTATHRERLNMYIILVCAILNILLNLALIPLYGAIGSSIASLLTIGLVNAVLMIYFIREDLRGAKILGPLVKVAISSVVMAAAILLINANNLVLYVLMGAAVYFVTLLLIGGLSKDDVDFARKILLGNDRDSNAVFNIIYKIVRG